MANKLVAMAMAVKGFVSVVRDPREIDGVFSIVDALRTPEAMQPMMDWFGREQSGRQALERREPLRVDLRALEALPEETLGRRFADHMRKQGFDPGDFPSVPVKNEMDYISAHLYETHDVWHVVTGMGTDVAGELGLQAFYLAQFPARLAVVLLAAGMLNTLGAQGFEDRDRRMHEIVRGWLMGRAAKQLFGVDWASLWGLSLTEVRARLKIDLPRVDGSIDAFDAASGSRLAA